MTGESVVAVLAAPRGIGGRRHLRRDLVLVLAAAAVGVTALAAYAAVQIVRQGDLDEAQPADAIVVLGAAQYNGVPSAVFAARLDHAIALYEQGLAKLLVVTGGKLPGDRFTEAETAATYAERHGVPAEAIIGENSGRDTLESLEAVGAILRSHHLSSAIFVSDRTHMLRVLRMATDQGLRAWGSPTADSPTDLDRGRKAQAVAHELAGIAVYLVGGGRWIDDPAVMGNP